MPRDNQTILRLHARIFRPSFCPALSESSDAVRMELDKIPLWRGNHVAIKQLAEDFASFIYLPRLNDSSVLIGAIRNGLPLMLWMQDAFAFADSFDESAGRYRSLHCGEDARRRCESAS